jgi:hypothetical protein
MKIVDVDIYAEGNSVKGNDVYEDGSTSLLTPLLMECETPEHAEVMTEILDNPLYMVYISTGKLTVKKFNAIVERWREEKNKTIERKVSNDTSE